MEGPVICLQMKGRKNLTWLKYFQPRQFQRNPSGRIEIKGLLLAGQVVVQASPPSSENGIPGHWMLSQDEPSYIFRADVPTAPENLVEVFLDNPMLNTTGVIVNVKILFIRSEEETDCLIILRGLVLKPSREINCEHHRIGTFVCSTLDRWSVFFNTKLHAVSAI